MHIQKHKYFVWFASLFFNFILYINLVLNSLVINERSGNLLYYLRYTVAPYKIINENCEYFLLSELLTAFDINSVREQLEKKVKID